MVHAIEATQRNKEGPERERPLTVSPCSASSKNLALARVRLSNSTMMTQHMRFNNGVQHD